MATPWTDIELNLPAGGAWAVGVSGGADSVGLLLLLRGRGDVRLHVAHLDHELRGEASEGDAVFVRRLAEGMELPCTIAKRSEIEAGMKRLPRNASARYRAVRMELFRQVVEREKLSGVMLAHHADDLAETVLQRLIRGSGAAGLAGMAGQSSVGGLRIVRPLLGVRRETLRELLRARGQDWREDASNQSDAYLRNRLRKILAERPGLTEALLELARACGEWKAWAREAAPRLGEIFVPRELAALPAVLGREAARRWLIERGARGGDLTPGVLDRLLLMAADAATPAVQQFPGGVTVRRRGGRVIGIIG